MFPAAGATIAAVDHFELLRLKDGTAAGGAGCCEFRVFLSKDLLRGLGLAMMAGTVHGFLVPLDLSVSGMRWRPSAWVVGDRAVIWHCGPGSSGTFIRAA